MIIPYFYQISGIPSFVCALDIGVWPPEPGPDTRYSVAAALWDLVLGEEDWKIIILTTLLIIFFSSLQSTAKQKPYILGIRSLNHEGLSFLFFSIIFNDLI